MLVTITIWRDTPFIAFSILLLFAYFNSPRPLSPYLLFSLSVFVALCGLVKISYLMIAFYIQAMIALDTFFVKKKIPVLLFIFIATYLLGWLALGQKLYLLPEYFVLSSELSIGFSAMSATGKPMEIISYLFCCLLIEFLLINQLKQRENTSSLIGALALAGTLFLLFKAGFTRHDGHVLCPIDALLLFSLLFFLPKENRSFSSPSKVIAIIYIAALTFTASAASQNYRGNNFKYVRKFFTNSITVAKESYYTVSGQYSYPDDYNKAMQQIKKDYPLPPLTGTADLYPFNQTLVLANGFQYDPRPIFQSYVAYTPVLLEKNAEHLRGANAPQHILFSIEPIDRQYPSLEDGLSWPELLTRYSAKGIYGNYLLLNKRDKILNYNFELIETFNPDFAESVTLPQGFPVWAKVSLPLTFFGKVTEFLFKLPIVDIGIVSGNSCKQEAGFDEHFYLTHYPDVAKAVNKREFSSGLDHYIKDGEREGRLTNQLGTNNRFFRLIPGMSEAGFLISPLIESGKEFSYFSNKEMALLKDKQVCNMAIFAPESENWLMRLLYKKPKIEFYELVIE